VSSHQELQGLVNRHTHTHTHTSDRGFPAAAGTTGWPKWFAVGLGRVERPVK
jgi:hypothetical protein